ncbi:hypothetical protein FJZ31_02470 [Candidatus Poribacteria bacterium]|nr:hypothetical protein [Candidatus Poribacteria bacterium]
MKRKRPNITPHEPDQPIAGIAEAISDSDAMRRVWEEKEQRAAKALRQLQKTGMTAPGAPPRSNCHLVRESEPG